MKKLKKILLILIMIFSLTGCAQYQTEMQIAKNKAMAYSTAIILDSQVLDVSQIFTQSNLKQLQKKGYQVQSIQEGTYSGIAYAKEVKNIDKISSKEETTYDLLALVKSIIYGEEYTEPAMFQIKKGLFKNTYIANFKFDYPDFVGQTVEDTQENTEEGTEDEEEYAHFSLTLPGKPKSHNATETDETGTQLSWTLSIKKANEIKFEFEIYNKVNIYLTIGISVILLIIIVTIIRKIIAKKKEKAEKKRKELERMNEAPLNYYFKSDEIKQQQEMLMQLQALQAAQAQAQENNAENEFSGKPINENEKIDLMPDHSNDVVNPIPEFNENQNENQNENTNDNQNDNDDEIFF